jgi:ferrous iron transport protein A
LKTLADLKKGQSATIHSFTNPELSIKFLEMGCVPNQPIKVAYTSLFGNNLCIEVLNYQLALRKDEAAQILINQ